MSVDYGAWGPGADLPSALGSPWAIYERVSAVPVSATGLIVGRKSCMTGFSLTETTGTASASFRLINGINTSGIVLARINLAPSESAREYLPFPWLLFPAGIFGVLVSGAVEGSVSTITVGES